MRWLWKLPLLRRLSFVWRGALIPVFPLGLMMVCAIPASNRYAVDLSGEFFRTAAQLGATLLVAYALQAAWVIQNSPRRRGSNRENWVGMACGIGFCALLGVLIALALSSHTESLSLLERFGFAWVVVSVLLLGVWTALQPWAMYHWTHSFTTEYLDE